MVWTTVIVCKVFLSANNTMNEDYETSINELYMPLRLDEPPHGTVEIPASRAPHSPLRSALPETVN